MRIVQDWRYQGLLFNYGVLSFILFFLFSYFDYNCIFILYFELLLHMISLTELLLHIITLTDTHTDTHTEAFSRNTLDEGSAPRNAQHSLDNIYTTGHIPTRTASNQAAADLRLRPRGQRNWRLWSYKVESDRLGGEVG